MSFAQIFMLLARLLPTWPIAPVPEVLDKCFVQKEYLEQVNFSSFVCHVKSAASLTPASRAVARVTHRRTGCRFCTR